MENESRPHKDHGDVVIYVDLLNTPKSSAFETYGLKAIRASLDFYLETGLMDKSRLMLFEVAAVDGPEHSCNSPEWDKLPPPAEDYACKTFCWNMDSMTQSVLNQLHVLSKQETQAE